MLKNFLVVVNPVGILFLLMAIGFLLGKLRWLNDESSAHINQIVVQISLPCMVVKSLQIPFTTQLASALLWGGAVFLLQSAGMILLAQATLRKTSGPVQTPLRFSIVYSNSMFMGLSLLISVMGDEAAIYGAPMLLVTQAFLWTHGVYIMGGSVSSKKLFLNPGVLSILIGVMLFLLEIRLPTMVYTTLEHMSNINTPLIMIIVGYQMSKAPLREVFTNRKLYIAVFVRLIISPVLAILLALPFRTTNSLLFCSIVILAAAPAAGTTASFAQQYNKDAKIGAQVTTLSTLLSLITLPTFALISKNLIV